MQTSKLSIIALIVYAILFPQAVQANKVISLKRALSMKLISVNAISKGGYCGKSLKLALQNNTPDRVSVTVDPAMIFKPEDTSYQDLVTLGGDTVSIGAWGTETREVQSFCGKLHASCPRANINYSFKRQGDTNMVKTLKYAYLNAVPISIVQSAVWAFTDGIDINNVYWHSYHTKSVEFVTYLAKILKQPVPVYYVERTTTMVPGKRVEQSIHSQVYVKMAWGHTGYKHMYLTVLKENGEVYKRIEADRVIDKNGISVRVAFDTRRDPKGTYLVRLHDDTNKTWDLKTVHVGGINGDDVHY